MRLIVIGCSGSFAGPDSPASCYLVQSEHEGRTWNLLLDLGNGALGALQRHVALDAVDGVMLTHLHPDHCADLAGYFVVRKYMPGGPLPGGLPVHGPAGTRERLARLYGADAPEDVGDQFTFTELADRAPVRIGPFAVTPYLVHHPVEAYGFRVEADGAVLAYTGDTDACPALDELCADADLVLADSAFVDGRDDDLQGVHLTGSRAARAVVDAGGVKRLMLTHIPPWNDPRVCQDQAATVWSGDVELACAGRTYEL
ncbi:MBL fold metallo-hydrolase [Luteipulveratus sp. YIM 133132]|uniref:MBL fold metallo-hydrolase n=1 Tax=Luteipulveratus flavus TaxID=3031728 RepID=A0ABT6C912_9MICO|nr:MULTISPECIES: MBL fold metallo-hydrolase [unclassified Luteipulveratus]MDE9366320.1 MBL fold metallo-hydrolase [Luteipulveratus sp. YIM 133132]MDF8265411.1 MBL fold metallo-hydrolase [Luteipulveratus sp. YIM 133296]